MKIQNQFLVFLLLLITSSSYGQYIGFEEINDSNVKTWIPSSIGEYEGVYDFGESEGESTFTLFRAGGKSVAQIRYGEFNEDATAWIMKYINLTNASFNQNGEFYSNEYGGEFAIYKNGNEAIRGLKIYDSWSGVAEKGQYEFGEKRANENYFEDKYPQASRQLLDSKGLEKLSKKELQLMRNEIFARYGYQFKKGGAMDSHFGKQEWYRPQHSNVDNFLTWLEKENIKVIQAVERSK